MSASFVGASGLKRVLAFSLLLLAGAGLVLVWVPEAAALTVRDEFSTIAYNNNDGTNNWSTDWTEINDDGSPFPLGAIFIWAGELYIRRNGNPDKFILRGADLSGATSATFSFDYRTTGNLENRDRLRIYVSADGGSSWTLLDTLRNDGSGTLSYDITAYATANTQIRFRADSGLTGSEYFIIDNVEIDYSVTLNPVNMTSWEESY